MVRYRLFKQFFVFFIFLHLYSSLPAQLNKKQLDSLALALQKNTDDSLKVNMYNLLGKNLLDQNAKIALLYIKDALRLAQKTNYRLGESQAHFLNGLYFENKQSYNLALPKYELALELIRNSAKLKTIAELLFHIGICYDKLEYTELSIVYYFKASRFYREVRDYLGQMKAIKPVADKFYNMHKYEKALKYFEEVLNLAERSKNQAELALAYTKLANTHNKIGDYQKALDLLNKSVDFAEKSEDNNIETRINISFGEVYTNLEDFKKAEDYLMKALKTARDSKDENLAAEITSTLADIFVKQGNYPGAIALEKGSIELNQKLKNTYALKDNYLKMSGFFSKTGDFQNSLKYYQLYNHLQDSLYHQKLEEAILKAEIEHDVEVKRMEIERLRETKREQDEKLKRRRWLNYYLLAGVGLLAFFALVLYYNNAQKIKTNKILHEQNRLMESQNEVIRKQKASLEEAYQKLGQKNQNLLDLNEEKDHLIGVVAHDLRSPLNQVKGFIEIIRLDNTHNLSPEQSEYLNLAGNSLERLSTMINRILDVNAMEKQGSNLQISNFDLALLIRNVVNSFEEQAASKNIKIISDLPDSHFFVSLDENYTIQIFENLISNALKFSPKNTQIYINLSEIADKLIASVKDEGPGFREEDKAKLFGKFQKLSAKPTAGEASTGLGLSIIKKYVDLMKGKVWLDSEEGEGATFYVEFTKAEKG